VTCALAKTGFNIYLQGNAAESAKEVNFIDVVDIDKNDALDGYIREDLLGTLIEGLPFKILVILTIILNTVVIGVQTDSYVMRLAGAALQIFDLMFLTVFVVEILLKFYHGFFLYWKSGWNVFNFLVVVISLLGVVVPVAGNRVGKIIQSLRVFRILRCISIVPGLKVIVGTFVQSIPDLMNLLFLLFLIMLLFSLVGFTLFAALLPEYFNNVPNSMYTLFIFLTQDGWGDILNAFLQTSASHWVPGVYMVLFIILGPFIMANAFIGVIVNNLQNVFKQLQRTQKAKHRQLNAMKKDREKLRDTVRADGPAAQAAQLQQSPMEFADLSKLDETSFENYCLILSAIEDNLAEFKQLKETLEQILVEVKKLNEQKAAAPEVGQDSGPVEEEDAYTEPPGDILSQMIRHPGTTPPPPFFFFFFYT